MSSTYTSSLQIQQIGNGEQSGTWGTTTNTNMALVDQAVAGAVTITMSNANRTLTQTNGASDEARNMVLEVVGTNSGVYQIIVPYGTGGAGTGSKMYLVYNNTTGGYAITIGYASGSTVSIPNGYIATVFGDGTNFFSANTTSAGAFNVNGTLTASGVADVGNLSVSGTTTLTGTATAPTVTSTDSSTNIATTAFVKSVTGTLGTMSTQNANAVAITGGTMAGVTVSGGNAITTSNIGSQSVSFATTAGNGGVTSVNGNTGTVTVSSLGVGQTWQDVSGSRSFGTTYTNSTSNPIMVSASTYSTYNPSIAMYVGSVFVAYGQPNTNGGNNAFVGATMIVPAGATYRVVGSGSLEQWAELR